MPEAPDFDRIARDHLRGAPSDPLWTVNVAAIAEQLRLVWNARGAADIAALEPIIEKLGDTMDPDNARSFVGDALLELDR